MEASIVPVDEVLSIETATDKRRNHLDIFNTCGTQGCLLDCQNWQTVVRLKLRRTTTTGSKREKQRDLAEFIRSSAEQQHQLSQSDTKLTDLPRKVTRNPFTLRDLDRSSENGCGCCRFFMVVFWGVVFVRFVFVLVQLIFERMEYRLLLN